MDKETTSLANATRLEPQSSEELQLWVTDEITALGIAFNEKLTSERIQIYARALEPVGQPRLKIAFNRALHELKFFPKISELIELAKLEQGDGRPGPEEAWMACPRSEDQSVVWTLETAEAFGLVRALMNEDQVAARMAFKEKYGRLIAEARAQGRSVEWKVSLGWDKADRVRAIAEGVTKNQISSRFAYNVLSPTELDEFRLALPPERRKELPGAVEDTRFLSPLQKVVKQLAEAKAIPSSVIEPKPKFIPQRPRGENEIVQTQARVLGCESGNY